MLLAIALFLAGAKWRALATSSGSGTQAPLLGIDATLARALRSRLAEILGVKAPEPTHSQRFAQSAVFPHEGERVTQLEDRLTIIP